MNQPVGPRFGSVTRANGEVVPLVFQPTDDPTVFVGLHTGTEKPFEMRSGDRLAVDVIGAGQSIRLAAALAADAERRELS